MNPADKVWEFISFYPEQWFTQDVIEINTGLSSHYVKMARRELESRGLVQFVRNKGMRVQQ